MTDNNFKHKAFYLKMREVTGTHIVAPPSNHQNYPMIQKKVIDAIYKKYRRRPDSPDELNLPLLFEKLPEESNIEIDGDNIIINSIDSRSPFHEIPVNHIHAIIEFDEAVAIVLHSSIIFLSKDDGSAHIHLKNVGPSLLDRLRGVLGSAAF